MWVNWGGRRNPRAGLEQGSVALQPHFDIPWLSLCYQVAQVPAAPSEYPITDNRDRVPRAFWNVRNQCPLHTRGGWRKLYRLAQCPPPLSHQMVVRGVTLTHRLKSTYSPWHST
jgi:hypothetical protein